MNTRPLYRSPLNVVMIDGYAVFTDPVTHASSAVLMEDIENHEDERLSKAKSQIDQANSWLPWATKK